MACCAAHRSNADVDEPEAGAPSALSSLNANFLSNAGIEPVMLNTRDADKTDVLAQRKSAYIVMRNSSMQRQQTRLAAPRKVEKRMSRIGTFSRTRIVKGMEEAAKEPQITHGASLGTAESLLQRLESLGLTSVKMVGDGNCQFRAIADQLFGSQEHHKLTRSVAIAHMKKNADFFGIYFETPTEYTSYLRDMARSRTWGDELTLRASVEAFGCVAHVVTSESSNWYLVYTPESLPDEAELAQVCAAYGLAPPKSKKEVFVNYISPIHYNAIAALASEGTSTSLSPVEDSLRNSIPEAVAE